MVSRFEAGQMSSEAEMQAVSEGEMPGSIPGVGAAEVSVDTLVSCASQKQVRPLSPQSVIPVRA